MKSGAELTNTPSLTIRSTRSSEPSAAFIWASSMIPQRRAAAMPAVEVDVLAEPAFDQAAVLGEADLAGDVEQAADLDRGDIGGDRGGGLREG